MVIFTSGGIGDRICFIPVLQYIYQRVDDNRSKLLFGSTDLMTLYNLNIYKWTQGGAFPPSSQQLVYNLDIAQIHEYYNYRLHPVQASYDILGFQWNGFPDAQIESDSDWMKAYDYVIAPYSRDITRSCTFPFIFDLVNNLCTDSNINICILGSWGDSAKFNHPRCTLEINRTWKQVAGILKNCKRKIITCDSSVNRLTQIMRLKNHILLAHNSVPIDWARSQDTQHTFYGDNTDWKVSEVLEKC